MKTVLNVQGGHCETCASLQWLLITTLVYFVALVLGGVSVFTDSWARLRNVHIGLFASCNVTTGVCVWNGILECSENVTECQYSKFVGALMALTV